MDTESYTFLVKQAKLNTNKSIFFYLDESDEEFIWTFISDGGFADIFPTWFLALVVLFITNADISDSELELGGWFEHFPSQCSYTGRAA